MTKPEFIVHVYKIEEKHHFINNKRDLDKLIKDFLKGPNNKLVIHKNE